jgi:hypothetical protein
MLPDSPDHRDLRARMVPPAHPVKRVIAETMELKESLAIEEIREIPDRWDYPDRWELAARPDPKAQLDFPER